MTKIILFLLLLLGIGVALTLAWFTRYLGTTRLEGKVYESYKRRNSKFRPSDTKQPESESKYY